MAAALRGASFYSSARCRGFIISSLNSCILPFQLISFRGIASKLFVGGLSFYMSEDTLAEAFSKFGQVVEARLVIDRVSDRPKGFGFVTFASEDEAQNALKQMNGKVLNGRVIFVDIAKAKPTYAFPISRGPPNLPSSE
ncbi:glycine-rich RNA-binding protein 4, mitochondrial [Phalaenopsis equestris]|uniref:glycine-rich RNA-binding protein 4, mitochondrial n=1 Tax=Phalaenopsis equestris TaxID=78828 RepID=UPI0009E2030D|nr:glycine-rich RNA-binding protein 4, mitochondrial [Phalaenopsis equestris]